VTFLGDPCSCGWVLDGVMDAEGASVRPTGGALPTQSPVVISLASIFCITEFLCDGLSAFYREYV